MKKKEQPDENVAIKTTKRNIPVELKCKKDRHAELSETDVELGIKLVLRDSENEVFNIEQVIKIPYVKSPAFISSGYEHVSKTLNTICLDYFERVVREYFRNSMAQIYTQKEFKDEKTAIDYSPSPSELIGDENPIIDLPDGSSPLDHGIELEIET